jgi:hypothetical protein
MRRLMLSAAVAVGAILGGLVASEEANAQWGRRVYYAPTPVAGTYYSNYYGPTTALPATTATVPTTVVQGGSAYTSLYSPGYFGRYGSTTNYYAPTTVVAPTVPASAIVGGYATPTVVARPVTYSSGYSTYSSGYSTFSPVIAPAPVVPYPPVIAPTPIGW